MRCNLGDRLSRRQTEAIEAAGKDLIQGAGIPALGHRALDATKIGEVFTNSIESRCRKGTNRGSLKNIAAIHSGANCPGNCPDEHIPLQTTLWTADHRAGNGNKESKCLPEEAVSTGIRPVQRIIESIGVPV